MTTTPVTSVTPAIALYCRASTEDQAERQTVQAQLTFLRRYCDLHQNAVADVYVDDGISGTVPLHERPEGRRLLEDAEATVATIDHAYQQLRSIVVDTGTGSSSVTPALLC